MAFIDRWTRRKRLRGAVLLPVALLLVVTAEAQAQSAALGWFQTDHDPNDDDWKPETESIPPGLTLAFTAPIAGPFHARVAVGIGVRQTRAAVWAAPFGDLSERIVEDVRYSGGTVYAGLALRPWKSWGTLGVGGELAAGLTTLWAAERGLETGDSLSDRHLALSGGFGVEAGVLISPDRDLWLTALARTALHKSIIGGSCNDCYTPLGEEVAERTFGLALRWAPGGQ